MKLASGRAFLLGASLLLPLACLAASPAAQGNTANTVSTELARLDAFIEQEMGKEKTPGLAIAVVKDGKVLYQRSFGYRDLEQRLPVTEQTAFPIASVTKSFTVLSLGSLVQDGALDWDTPVRHYLPDFQLHDPVATERMTARDLVSHRSGLPRHDALWYGSTASRAEMWHALRGLEPSADFRARYQYNNLMFLAAGYLAGEVAGTRWEDLLQQRVLEPLGLHGTSVNQDGFRGSAQPANGYGKDGDEKLVKLPFANIDAIAPAGAINSTLADMTRYLQMHLGDGRLDGKSVFDPSLLTQMRLPLITDPAPSRDAEIGQTQYGMGLFLTSYRGHRHIQHGGNIDGYTSFLSYLPDDGIGVVILSNLNHSQLGDILPYRIYDELLGLDSIDWSGRLAARKASDEAAEIKPEAKDSMPSLRKTGTRPAHPLLDYVGTYRNAAYGDIVVNQQGKALTMQFHAASTPLEHYHYEVFRAPEDALNPLARERVTFETALDGDVAALRIQLETAVAPAVFTRVPDPKMLEHKFLAPLAGRYRVGSDIVDVRLREDGVLVAQMNGRGYELRAVRGNRFTIIGMPEQWLEFTRDAQGQGSGFMQFQPWGDSSAVREPAL